MLLAALSCHDPGPDRCEDAKGPEPCDELDMTLHAWGGLERSLDCDATGSSITMSETGELACLGRESKDVARVSAAASIDITRTGDVVTGDLAPTEDGERGGWVRLWTHEPEGPSWLAFDEGFGTCSLEGTLDAEGRSHGILACSGMLAIEIVDDTLRIADAEPIDLELTWSYAP